MIRKLSFIVALAVCAQPVLAQDGAGVAPDADPAAAYAAARNQLGILKYCQQQGFTGAEAVAVQERILGMLPPGNAAEADAAEAKGAEGVVTAMGVEISLTDSAARQGTTAEAHCQQIEAIVNQLAGQFPAN